ncbi:Glu/Leu/Phe/Val dehydrogenase [Candidatus Nomurabacteria bacterium]|nr:Glu/Leu/Phe/Val dehydrogenase [Candidatus Nomurabacteria bacterium]
MITDITNNPEIRALPEFENHNGVFLLENKDIGFKGYISIHRKNPTVPSFGATRMWAYKNGIEGLRDSLRLSRMMSYKAALAGLDCGGGKGVIIANPTSPNREELLREYAKNVDLLKGKFITGTDVGLCQRDLAIMKEETPYIVGFNDNSVEFTTLGIYNAIQVSLQKVFSTKDVSKRSFAIQGVGNIGAGLIKLLSDSGCRIIYVSDIIPEKIKMIKEKFPDVKIVDPKEIHKLEVDVFCPCALGGVINEKTIQDLRCKIVAGGANNQLEKESLGTVLFEKHILYAPDYIANAGGLISVFDEYSNKIYNKDTVSAKVMKIKDILNEIFIGSDQNKKATNIIANEIAEKKFNNF